MIDDPDLLDLPEPNDREGAYIRWLGEYDTRPPVEIHDVMGQPMTIEELAARVRRNQDEELGNDA